MRMGPVSFLVILVVMPTTLGAQRQASLGMGTGIVRYAGGSSFGVLTLAPAAQRLSPFTYLGAGGAVSLLERGVWAGQARADIWAALTRQAGGLRDRKSTRLNSCHVRISYAVFCLKKKKKKNRDYNVNKKKKKKKIH